MTTEWQPIETAPKCTATYRAVMLVTRVPHVGQRAPILQACHTRNGFMVHGGQKLKWKPTHWHPLPEPPKAA